MRLKTTGTSVYHCISRVVGGEKLLDAAAREVLRKMVWKVAAFSGVEVLTYCVLSNHMHILVRVPAPQAGELTRAELLRRYALIYGEGYAGIFPDAQSMAVILASDSEEAACWEARLKARMHDVSAFMKTLKQRFTWWYNRKNRRFGTLWAERFKSVLVEDDPRTLAVVAAYIDLNPIRAGMADDPAHYRWCGYSEAMAGDTAARQGLASVTGERATVAESEKDWSERVAAPYRMVLYGKGGQGRIGEQGAIDPLRVKQVLDSGGKVTVEELIHCRVRYFSDGAILGSAAFVRATGEKLGLHRSNRKKNLGQMPVSQSAAPCAWRNLRVRPVG